MAALAAAGEREVTALIDAAAEVLRSIPDLEVDYLAVVGSESLDPLDRLPDDAGGARTLVAVRLGDVRLIDNTRLT
jgi:pantoate--beta-alanine ligase